VICLEKVNKIDGEIATFGTLLTKVCFTNYLPNQMKKILFLGLALFSSAAFQAQIANCSEVFISEYVEGSANNKAIELYNPTAQPIVLDGSYSMGRERNGIGTPMLLPITGTIAPFDVRVFVLDKRNPNGTELEIPVALDLQAKADTFLNPIYVEIDSPMYFNGDDAFFLIKNGNTIIDLLGRSGEDPGSGWWVPGDPLTRWWTIDQTLIRKSSIQRGVLENPSVFDPSLEWDSLPNNTFDNLGVHTCVCGTVAVNELVKHEFSVFPNPVLAGQFAVRTTFDMAAISLYSADGKLIIRKNVLGGQQYLNIEFPEAERGLYFIEIDFADGTSAHRKIISR